MSPVHRITLLAALSALLVAGCGGYAVAERRPDPIPRHRAEELERLEGVIETEERTLETLDPLACPERCRSVEAICDASEHICAIASELGDDGVTLRCAQATRSCDAARGGTDPSCACAMAQPVASIQAPARF